MNKKAAYGVLLALLLPLIGYFIVKNLGAKATAMPRHYIYDSVSTKVVNGKEVTDTIWHTISNFTFTNQLGRQVSLNDIKGKIIVADFFFTHCPTICPRLTQNLKQVHDGMKSAVQGDRQEQDYVQFLSFSIDPERDSVPELKKWADRFQINPESWWLLTGDKKKIYNLSIEDMKLGIVDGKNVDTNFYHTDYIVLLDKNRNIRGYYHGLDTSTLSQLSRDIIFLSLEKDPKRKNALADEKDLVIIAFLVAIIGIGILVAVLKRENKKLL